MPTPLDQLPGGITGLAKKVADLERQLREIRAAKRLGTSAFEGALRVVDSDGNTIAEIVSDLDGRAGLVAYDTRLGAEYYAALTAGDLRFGIVGETDPASEAGAAFADLGGGLYELRLASGHTGGTAGAQISAYSETAPAVGDSQIVLNANRVRVTGSLQVDGQQSVSSVQSGSYTVTSTTFTTAVSSGTYVDCGAVWVAPPSGRVVITTTARMINATAGSGSLVAPETRTDGTLGAGTSVEGAADGNGISYYGDSFARLSGVHHLTGLTPGATYNTRLLHRASANTSTIALRELIVEPCT
jgi:hypothetical protein